MNTEFYFVIFIYGDIEPEPPIGPFPTRAARDAAALQLRREHGSEHGYFALNVTLGKDEPKLELHAYRSDFFERVDSNA